MGSHRFRFASTVRLLAAACLVGGAAAGRVDAGVTYLSQTREMSATTSGLTSTPPVLDSDDDSNAGLGRWQNRVEIERTYTDASGRSTLAAAATTDSTLTGDALDLAGTLSASNAGDATGFSALASFRTEVTFRVDEPQAFDVTSFIERGPGGFPPDRSSSNVEIKRLGGESVFSLNLREDRSLDGAGTLAAGEYSLTYATVAVASARGESIETRYGADVRFAPAGNGGGGPVPAVPLPPAALAALLPLAGVMAGGRRFLRRGRAG